MHLSFISLGLLIILTFVFSLPAVSNDNLKSLQLIKKSLSDSHLHHNSKPLVTRSLLGDDGLLGKDGLVDGLLDEDGLLDRLLNDDGLLYRLVSDEGLLYRSLKLLLNDDGLLDRLINLLLGDEGLLDRLFKRLGLV